MRLQYNQVEDLVTDEGFLAWYYKNDAQQTAEWENRLANDPALKNLADEAAILLDSLKITEKKVGAKQFNLAEQRLFNNLSSEQGTPVVTLNPPVKRRKWIAWSAAAAVLLAIAGYGTWRYLQPDECCESVYKTAYSEIRTETLPDGSDITLNANTEIRFTSDWKAGTDREVWISGEAFFHVKSTPTQDKFIVHSGNFDVIVTGTQFNVVNRDARNNVLLKSGKVTVRGPGGEEVFMNPGDFLEYAANGLQKKIVSESPVIAWKERKLIFEKTPMKEVAASITEVYGIKVMLPDDSVAAIPVSGIFPNDNLDILLKSLEASQDFEIQKTDKFIQIRNR